VDFVISLEDRLFGKKLQHYTSKLQLSVAESPRTKSRCLPRAPHVHLGAIDCRAKQELRWAVPKGDNSVGIIATPPLLVESSEAKVGELQFTTVVDQDIRPLDITMDNSFVVKIGQSSKHLLAERLKMGVGETKLRLRKDACQVMVHILENHVHGSYARALG
jgi:hypothetical protein